MQVSATLIAAQQAAREARARLQVPSPQQVAKPDFAAALEKTPGTSGGFSALPLKQVAAPTPTTQPQTATPPRMGMHIDITI